MCVVASMKTVLRLFLLFRVRGVSGVQLGSTLLDIPPLQRLSQMEDTAMGGVSRLKRRYLESWSGRLNGGGGGGGGGDVAADPDAKMPIWEANKNRRRGIDERVLRAAVKNPFSLRPYTAPYSGLQTPMGSSWAGFPTGAGFGSPFGAGGRGYIGDGADNLDIAGGDPNKASPWDVPILDPIRAAQVEASQETAVGPAETGSVNDDAFRSFCQMRDMPAFVDTWLCGKGFTGTSVGRPSEPIFSLPVVNMKLRAWAKRELKKGRSVSLIDVKERFRFYGIFGAKLQPEAMTRGQMQSSNFHVQGSSQPLPDLWASSKLSAVPGSLVGFAIAYGPVDDFKSIELADAKPAHGPYYGGDVPKFCDEFIKWTPKTEDPTRLWGYQFIPKVWYMAQGATSDSSGWMNGQPGDRIIIGQIGDYGDTGQSRPNPYHALQLHEVMAHLSPRTPLEASLAQTALVDYPKTQVIIGSGFIEFTRRELWAPRPEWVARGLEGPAEVMPMRQVV